MKLTKQLDKKTKQILIKALQNFEFPSDNSKKGENGKVLIIGGSKLFHSASIWALNIASRFSDMVFYSSTIENNLVVLEAKKVFLNGIVIQRKEIPSYIQEADVILIGPGMQRPTSFKNLINFKDAIPVDFKDIDSENDTYKLTNFLVSKYNNKKWVIDGGALQTIDIENINKKTILTPNSKEFFLLLSKINKHLDITEIKNFIDKTEKISLQVKDQNDIENAKINIKKLLKNQNIKLPNAPTLKKGHIDILFNNDEIYFIFGGNAGMIKGGSGDLLAGLISSFYIKLNALESIILASFINKKSADLLFKDFGPFYTITELEKQIPKTFFKIYKDFHL